MVSRRLAFFAALAASTSAVTPALALQPLDAFLAGAKEANADNKIAHALADQRDAEADRALGYVLPGLNVRGQYQFNQFTSSVPKALIDPSVPTNKKLAQATAPNADQVDILPQNQLDGIVAVTVPVLDVGGWARHSAARSAADAALADREVTSNDVARQVTQAYYQLLAEEAVLKSATKNLAISQQNVQVSKTRKQGGAASTLDIQRGTASVASAQQDVAAATFQVATSRRKLETLTGIAPDPASTFPTDDLHEEDPIETYLGHADKTPYARSAQLTQEAADANATAASAGWIPTVNAQASEHVTNAPGLSLSSTYFTAVAVAEWRLDFAVPSNARAANAAATAATAKAEKAKREAADLIFADWHQIRASIDRARAARAQLAAAQSAADLTKDRFGSGMQTEVELLQAQGEAFRADVARIQADADLAYARAALRLDSAAMASEKTE